MSRFQRVGQFIPGLIVVASSAADESCFTEQLRREIEKGDDKNGQLVVWQAIYLVKPGLQLCSWRFKVSYGLPNVEPAVLSGCYDEAGQPISARLDCPKELAISHEPPAAGARWELVPGDYYYRFAVSPRKALQQLSGVSLAASNRLFPTLADIEKCLDISAREKVPVPTAAAIISVSDENSRMILEDLIHPAFVRRSGSGYEPVRHPQRLRYVHLDLAINGLAGLAVCHLADPPATDSSLDAFGSCPVRLIVEYDFILTLAGGRTRPICYEKILKFLFWLQNPCGFRFGLVTADSFQSEHMLQTLHSKGIKTANLSVDRDKKAYLAWQGGFQEHNIRLYRQPQLLREAAELIELEKKIDHPPNGTKDTSDAAAGAFLNAISSDEVHNLTVSHAPPAILGVSPFANASPEDPFGFFIRIPPRPIPVFQA